MDLSENDTIMLGAAAIGDLVILDQAVVKVTGRTDIYVQYMIQLCQVFAHCANLASTIIDHSILGHVPACERCKGILA